MITPEQASISIGDQLARWTSTRHLRIGIRYTINSVIDDVFKSTSHRAINFSGKERYSIPLFFGTDYDIRLEVRAPLKVPFRDP